MPPRPHIQNGQIFLTKVFLFVFETSHGVDSVENTVKANSMSVLKMPQKDFPSGGCAQQNVSGLSGISA